MTKISQKVALKQLKELRKFASKSEKRLAAEDWNEDWKTLISTILSARNRDSKTIPIAELLFKRYNSIGKLARANINDIKKIIKPINFYKKKAKNIINCAKVLVEKYNSKVPHDFEKLIELPGVGRKTANVFLAVEGKDRIGVDTHVFFISRYLGWTKHEEQEQIEHDLENLFPRKYWRSINYILVRFGQSYSRRDKLEILDKVKKTKYL
jgi:endonuclease-3